MISLDVKSDKFSAAIIKLRDIIGNDVGRLLLEEETRQVIKTIIRLDNKLANLSKPSKKPAKEGSGPQLTPGTKGVREFAVARAISRTMRPFRSEDFTTPRMREFVQKVEDGRISMLAANLLLFKMRKTNSPLRNVKFRHFDRDFHRSNIYPRYGHTANTGIRLIGLMSKTAYDRYVKEIQGHVGFKFSGFLVAARNLGLKLPKWISRHPPNKGSFEMVTPRDGNQYVLIRTDSSKDMRMRDRVRDSLRTRAGAMGTKARRIINGEATNLGFMTFNPDSLPLAQYRNSAEYRASLEALEEN